MTESPVRPERIQHTVIVPASLDMVAVVGVGDEVLRAIEAEFPDVDIHVRGNQITLGGSSADLLLVERLFDEVVSIVRTGQAMSPDGARRALAILRSAAQERPADVLTANILSNRGRTIRPKTLNQKRYVDAIDDNTITFGIGPAGTGKTYLAVAKAVQALQAKRVNRIVLTRPAVEAGERLGFLPGTLSEKIDPYLRPLYDALRDMLDPDSIPRLLTSGTIEVAPLAYMRGRTLNDAFVILDEAQNTSPDQMKMFLTRLGFGSTMVVTGDVTQVDLPDGHRLRAEGRSAHPRRRPRRELLPAHRARRRAAQPGHRHRPGLRTLRRGAGTQRARPPSRPDAPTLMGRVEVDDRSTPPSTWDCSATRPGSSSRSWGCTRTRSCRCRWSTPTRWRSCTCEWLDLPGPTDVLSFPMDELRVPGPGEEPQPGVLGDVVLCPQVAARPGRGCRPRHRGRARAAADARSAAPARPRPRRARGACGDVRPAGPAAGRLAGPRGPAMTSSQGLMVGAAVLCVVLAFVLVGRRDGHRAGLAQPGRRAGPGAAGPGLGAAAPT